MASAAQHSPTTPVPHFSSPVVEIFFGDNGVVETTGAVLGHVKTYAGKNAFRIYNALNESIGPNSIGTLQGMVKSARWKTVFNFATEWGERIEFLALFASFASNIAEARPEFDALLASN